MTNKPKNGTDADVRVHDPMYGSCRGLWLSSFGQKKALKNIIFLNHSSFVNTGEG
jgi:hypothetical protein